MRAPTTGSRISGATCRASRSRRPPPDAVVYLGHGPADAAASVGGMLTTDQKGTIAELAITREAIRHGIDVYAPSFSGGRYDLIFGVGPRLLRIQCEWARLSDNVITIRCYSSRRGPAGHIKRSYSSAEIDALAAYCPELERCYLVPVSRIDGRPTVNLRIGSAKNN